MKAAKFIMQIKSPKKSSKYLTQLVRYGDLVDRFIETLSNGTILATNGVVQFVEQTHRGFGARNVFAFHSASFLTCEQVNRSKAMSVAISDAPNKT